MHLRLSRLGGFVLLVLATAAAKPACNTVPASERSGIFEFRSGVLVDAERDVCYLMNTHDGIDALDVRSGEARWTTILAQKPLLLLENTLIAQAAPEGIGNALRLVFLDTANGSAKRTQIDIDLPEGVRASIDDGAGTSFRIKAWATQGGFAVKWTYSAALVRGALRDPTEARSAERRWEGAARVDLETGTVYPVEPGDRPNVAPPRLPAGLSRLEKSGDLLSPLWFSGDTYAAAARIRQDGSERTVLKRWRATTGDSLPDVTLFADNYTIQYPSADYRHLLASRRNNSTQASGRYDWMIFSLATGERIVEQQMDVPAAWFFVIGPVLIHDVPRRAVRVDDTWIEEPPKLRAIDMRTGIEQWIWYVRDTAFRGSNPPGIP